MASATAPKPLPSITGSSAYYLPGVSTVSGRWTVLLDGGSKPPRFASRGVILSSVSYATFPVILAHDLQVLYLPVILKPRCRLLL